MTSLSTSKLLALLALFVWQAHASLANSPRSLPARDEFVCPAEDIANTGCLGPKDCLYANPNNCNTFIRCIANADGTGTPVVLPCLLELEWNDNKKECDFPENSTCPPK
ncbi:Carbohydrate-binding module family 14 protein [Mycena venus]|uniref:Carbohydrate-binding module family 14 protein n=1 Tax=Mycena venus TaxID=2733690 RepID=A0A8H7CGW2_9AGAR|nr:Carbohydrate-binding module family 14 protein [Mycena venus]